MDRSEELSRHSLIDAIALVNPLRRVLADPVGPLLRPKGLFLQGILPLREK